MVTEDVSTVLQAAATDKVVKTLSLIRGDKTVWSILAWVRFMPGMPLADRFLQISVFVTIQFMTAQNSCQYVADRC